MPSDDLSEKFYQLREQLQEHMGKCDERFNRLDQALSQVARCQQANTDAISSLIEETRGVVRLHSDIQTATRIGKTFQKVVQWLVQWPLIGAGAYAAYTWLIKHFP